MIKRNLYLMFQIVLGFVLYYVLASFIDNMYILLLVIIVIGVVVIMIRSLFIRNDAEILEVLVKPDKYFEFIRKFEVKDSNKFNTLRAYGLSYTGKYEEAKSLIDKVVYKDIRTSRNLHYIYFATKLHLAYNNKDRIAYNKKLEEAESLKVFQKVEIPTNTFKVHSLLLEGNNEEAEMLLKVIIPKVKKRILVVELEYLLALSYFNQNKMIDCKAVCEFMLEKDYPTVHTVLCENMLNSIT